MTSVVRSMRIDEDLFKKASELAILNGYRSASGIVEKALQLYFELQGDLKNDISFDVEMKEEVKVARVTSTTTLDEDLVKRTRAFAHANGYKGGNDIIEISLKLYFELQENLDSDVNLDNILNLINNGSHTKKVQVYEKEMPNGKYQIVTIHNGHMSLDYVDKRINIDTISDIERLIDDGYQLVFEA